MKLSSVVETIQWRSRGLGELSSFDDFRRRARRRLPRMVFDFVDGGADGELSLAANRAAFEKVQWQPGYLRDVSGRDITTTVLGRPVDVPFLLSPAGMARLVHREGELAAARAAAAANTVFAVSTGSNYSLEEIADVGPGRRWFQLYLWKSQEVVADLVRRAAAADYEALVLTIDVPAVGKRERDLRNGMSLPPRIRPKNMLDTSWRWWWLYHLFTGPEITFGSLEGVADGDDASNIAVYVDRELNDPTKTWADLDWLRRQWDGPLLVKGVMTGSDASEAMTRGADGVIVSNHGGRQLDSLPGTLDVLPEIVDVIDDRGEVFLDGGVQRGEDIVKARALGARACMGGRAWFWALTCGGGDGIGRWFEVVRADVDRTLALVGCPRFDDVDSTLLRS